MPARAAGQICRSRKILSHRNLDHTRPVKLQRRGHRLGNILRTRNVKAARAVDLRQPVESRINQIDTDVARIVVALLLRLLSAVVTVC